MKLLFVLPLLFALASADEEILRKNQDVLINTLKKLEGTKIDLPKELVEQIHLESEAIGGRAIGITAVVDTYTDRILTYIKQAIIRSGLDPTEMPDATLNLIPTGTITLSSGWLQDISTIERNGNTTVNYSSSTKIIELYLPVKFSALLVTYKYLTEVLLLSIEGDANGKLEDVIVNIRLNYDYTTYQASLDTFEIKDSGRFSLKFTGNSLVDWITNTMTSVVTVFLQPVVIRIVQNMIKGGLDSVVDSVNEFIASIFNP